MSGSQCRAPQCSPDYFTPEPEMSIDPAQAVPASPQAGMGNQAAQERLGQAPRPRDADTAMGATAARLSTVGTAAAAGKAGQKWGDLTKAGNARFGAGMSIATAPLAWLAHFMGDPQVAESTGGQAAAATAKTAGDTAVDVGSKFAVAGGADLVPTLFAAMEAKKAIGGGVDAAGVMGSYLAGDHAAAFRGSDRLQENTINGEYGAPAQALSAIVDKDQREKLVDRKAERGERGLAAAWGNAAGDMWSEVAGHGGQGRGGTWHDWDSYAKQQREMRWYKPWTW